MAKKADIEESLKRTACYICGKRFDCKFNDVDKDPSSYDGFSAGCALRCGIVKTEMRRLYPAVKEV